LALAKAHDDGGLGAQGQVRRGPGCFGQFSEEGDEDGLDAGVLVYQQTQHAIVAQCLEHLAYGRRAFAPNGDKFPLRPEFLYPPCAMYIRRGFGDAGAGDAFHGDAPCQQLPVADMSTDEDDAAPKASRLFQNLALFGRPFHPGFRV
jgi:hypothetical protein